jgi:hypothetical protein
MLAPRRSVRSARVSREPHPQPHPHPGHAGVRASGCCISQLAGSGGGSRGQCTFVGGAARSHARRRVSGPPRTRTRAAVVRQVRNTEREREGGGVI